MKEVKETYEKLMKIQKEKQKPIIIFVYFGGHGATENEKQLFLLNNSDPKKVMFPLEFKMRYLANAPYSTARVCCVFDCCRVPLISMEGLKEEYERGVEKRGTFEQINEF